MMPRKLRLLVAVTIAATSTQGCGLESFLYLEPPVVVSEGRNRVQFKHASGNGLYKDRLISYEYEIFYKLYLGDSRLSEDTAALDAAFANAVSDVPSKLSSMGYKQLVDESGSKHTAMVTMAEIENTSLYFDYALDPLGEKLLYRKALSLACSDNRACGLYRANRPSETNDRCLFSHCIGRYRLFRRYCINR